MPASCLVYPLGLIPYDTAWRLQEALAAEVKRGESPAVLLLLEHPHTYTLGRRAQDAHLLWDEEERARRGIAVYPVDRGGDITYHGPGQLVGYPILRLAQIGWQGDRLPQADFVGYLRKLEQTLIATLGSLGVAAVQEAGRTGVWVAAGQTQGGRPYPQGKIASIGVKVDASGVTRHGFALNVAPDMTYWQGIIPCGLQDVTMLSLADVLEKVPSTPIVMDAVVSAFGDIFDYEMRMGDGAAMLERLG